MTHDNPIKRNWALIKLELKKNYPQLTETDLKYIDGYENEFYRNLEIKLGANREQLITILSSFNFEKSTYVMHTIFHTLLTVSTELQLANHPIIT